MNIYALSSLVASYVFFVLGIFIYQKDSRNELNRIYMVICVLVGYTAAVEFGLRQAVDAATAHTWLKIGFLWPLILPLYMHFALIFTKNTRVFRNRVTYFVLYVPALIFAVLELTTDALTAGSKREYWGWTYNVPENSLMYYTTNFWGIFLLISVLILCFLYFWRAEQPTEKRRAKYVFMGMLIPTVVSIVTEGIFPSTDIKVPELSIVATTTEAAIIAYGIHKYNIFALTPAVAAEDIVNAMSNLLFLVRKDGFISLANLSAVTLLGYGESELIDQPLESIFAEGEWEEIQGRLNNSADYTDEETIFMTKDGRMIPVLLSISVVRDKNGGSLGMVCVGNDLTDHKKAEEVQKKEILLKEIHHRVKNNMQIVSSLLSLQSRYTTDERYTEMFKESQNRIRSMALVHEKLYRSEDLENIDLREYIKDMVNGLVQSYSSYNITVKIEADDIFLGVDTAVPCGLIINELVSNALKYAFPGKKGEIKVGLRGSDGTIHLIVADNGIGIPDTVDFRTTETLGLRLVTILAEDQLDGEITLIRDKGTAFHITFREGRRKT